MVVQKEVPSLPTRTLIAKAELWEKMVAADGRLGDDNVDHPFLNSLRQAAKDDDVGYWDLVAMMHKVRKNCALVQRVSLLASAVAEYHTWETQVKAAHGRAEAQKRVNALAAYGDHSHGMRHDHLAVVAL